MVLANHLIGLLQNRLRDRDAERLGGFEVHDQFELARLLDRQAGHLWSSDKEVSFCLEKNSADSLRVPRTRPISQNAKSGTNATITMITRARSSSMPRSVR